MTTQSPVVGPSNGRLLRRRVRRITAWVVGVAGVGSAVLTVALAEGAPTATAATPAPTSGVATAPSTTPPSRVTAPGGDALLTAGPAPSAPSLAAPTQVPRSGHGRSQAQSGGS